LVRGLGAGQCTALTRKQPLDNFKLELCLTRHKPLRSLSSFLGQFKTGAIQVKTSSRSIHFSCVLVRRIQWMQIAIAVRLRVPCPYNRRIRRARVKTCCTFSGLNSLRDFSPLKVHTDLWKLEPGRRLWLRSSQHSLKYLLSVCLLHVPRLIGRARRSSRQPILQSPVQKRNCFEYA